MMEELQAIFTPEEREQAFALYGQLKNIIGPTLQEGDEEKLRNHLMRQIEQNRQTRGVFGLNPVLFAMQTALIVAEEIGLRRDAVIAILLYPSIENNFLTVDEVGEEYGPAVSKILHGLQRIAELYKKNPVVESENFRNLLLSFAEDMRVILIMIANRVNLMRQIRDTHNDEAKKSVSQEAAYLYAPLAHKLGLYKLKSELEDLSLKYLEKDVYYSISEKLNATKKARDEYIESFISPIAKKLTDAGLTFHMKGRTKSIHSIWQKMKKQNCDFEGVYDLFAIRVIIDCPLEKEKMLCWQAYSIITDMYMPNPKRLRDWLSVPKSNGYESLHITVLGPEKKWVEVQIRTERMDEVAEKGVAAHWRYKGVKGESGLDGWLNNIRQMLETNDGLEAMDQFKMDLYEDEVYVFTPRGDLLKFPKGSTVLDFAYHIHSKIGNTCVGARINNKVVTFREVLQSGDQIEVMTSSVQKPKQDWLNYVKSSHAKAKIRQALKEAQQKDGLFAKEMIERKFKNKKIDIDDVTMSHVIKRLGFKVVSDFYKQIANNELDVNRVIEVYQELLNKNSNNAELTNRSADEFKYDAESQTPTTNDDVLVIDRNLKGIDYQLARCCQPIYGDPIFGFVTVNGGIKVHREDCPNAAEMRRRFGYRIVRAKWDGKGTTQYGITLRVIGVDDIGIVNNLTNIISRDEKLILRSINIDSNDGIFRGTLVVLIENNYRLETLLKKLRIVKGVKQIYRV